MLNRTLASLILAALAGSATAATITVDALGGGDHTTIQAAIDASTDPSDIIVVKNTGVYDEALNITKGLTIEGELPGDRPVVALQPNATQASLGGSGDGIYIQGDGISVTLKNLILIPSATTPITDDIITGTTLSSTGLTTLDVTMENLLVTANDGSNNPVATSVWDDPDLGAAGVVGIPDDGIYFLGRADFGGNAGILNLTYTDVLVNGVGGDCIVSYPGVGGSNTFSGTKVANGGRYGMQVSDEHTLTATGSKTNPSILARSNDVVGLIFFGASNVTADHIVSVDNTGFGLRCDNDTITGTVSITDSLFAFNSAEGLWISFASASGPKTWTVSDSTFFGNGTGDPGTDDPFASVKLEAAVVDLTLTLTDCVIAGANSGFENLSAAAPIQADFCAIPTAGPAALAAVSRNTSTGTVTITNDVAADPQFRSTATTPLDGTSFDVTAPTLETASSTSGNLSGWGDWVELLQASNWSIYE